MSQMCSSASRATAGRRFRGSVVPGTAVIQRLHGLPGIVLNISKSRAQNRMCCAKPCIFTRRNVSVRSPGQEGRGLARGSSGAESLASGVCVGAIRGIARVTSEGVYYEKKHNGARL